MLSKKEIATKFGITTRTLEFWQTERIIPKPRRCGKKAMYAKCHENSLEAVLALRDNGMSLKTIKSIREDGFDLQGLAQQIKGE